MTQRRFRFGISTTVDYSVPIDAQLPAIKKAGFDFISMGSNDSHSGFLDEPKFKAHLSLANKLGLDVTSIHLPFGVKHNISSPDNLDREFATGILGLRLSFIFLYRIPLAIIHPHHYFDGSLEDAWERGRESLRQIITDLPAGLHLAVENLPDYRGSWFCTRILNEFGPDQLGFCYDSSHENMSGVPFHLLEKFYNRVTITHLSDNHGQADEHLIPGDGNIDWTRMRQFLEKSPNLTDILFEVGTGDPLEMPLEQFLEKTMTRAREYFG